MNKNPNPSVVGETFRNEYKVLVCRECGYRIHESGLCTYGCTHDSTYPSQRDPKSIVVKVYQTVETLVREEDYPPQPGSPASGGVAE